MDPFSHIPWLGKEISKCDAIVSRSFDYSGSAELKKILKRTHVGGKRLRPALIFLCSRLGDGRNLENVPYGAAVVELLHLASLFHDDVIDNTVVRRKKLSTKIELGNKVSILVGDYLLAESMDLLARHLPPELTPRFTSIIKSMVKSEILSKRHTYNFELSKTEYLEIVQEKTASLFSFGAYTGIAMASGDRDLIEQIRQFGLSVGTAYQIIDDLEDLWGLNDEADNDLANGYVSLPVIEFMRRVNGKTREGFVKLFRDSASDFEKLDVIRQMVSFSVLRSVYTDIMKHLDRARTILSAAKPGEARDILSDFCNLLKQRALDTVSGYEEMSATRARATTVQS